MIMRFSFVFIYDVVMIVFLQVCPLARCVNKKKSAFLCTFLGDFPFRSKCGEISLLAF